ncbi:right-handed parallel beta-helix repeat-containing protein [Candidatus Uabimicrobium amorphum]|uniref:Right handed beta helix domain-containing protein n=1 Tax=Uabimicrobium amorphum TaxID=2596890 RepID=A0A5S9IQF3_UABAM|nr:right-handed parallel beta-helix repeat-containing protein [Candidatus Uabimicrobium amorphum]BBM85817.1 hypothetical protein UABAM_04195 [Candidatus Uabimicrobium amorphum]
MRILLIVLSTSLCWANTIWVSPQGGKVVHENKEIKTVTLEEALEQKTYSLQLLPGTYAKSYVIKYGGQPDNPVVIYGNGDVVFDGETKPGDKGDPAFLVNKKQWVVFDNISFRNYWNTAILIKNSRYITVRNSRFTGARWPIFVRDKETHHVLVEDNHWVQDPSGKVWHTIPWAESHHGDYGFLNGALLGGKKILGSVVFRRNTIRYAYNGIRIVGNREKHHIDNFNVEVYDNTFEYVRDNPVEPEGSASNWWIHHNRFYNCYALLSFTEVAGEKWFVFRNIGWWDEEPGKDGGHTRGKIYKFAGNGPYPRGEFWAFHNSWYSRSPLIMGGITHHFYHYNNAVFYTGEVNIIEGANGKEDVVDVLHPSYELDYNIANLAYPKNILQSKREQHSIHADPKFSNAPQGKFSLEEDSPAIDKGKVLQIGDWQSVFDGKAPDMGAFEKDKCLPGPPFCFMSDKYQERPRIVRLEMTNNDLRIWFSVVMPEKEIEVRMGDNKITAVLQGHSLKCKIPDGLGKENIYLPKNLCGTNGLHITLWSCQYKNIGLYE